VIETEILLPVLAYLKGRGMTSALTRCETFSGWRNSAFEQTEFKDAHHWYRLLLENPSYLEPYEDPRGYTLSSKMFKETTMEDLSRFAEVITDSFTEIFDYFPVTAKLIANMRDASTDLQRVSWMERDGVVTGMCLSEESTEYNREHGAKMGYVLVLCVRKDSQGHGVGGALLSDGIRWIMDRGMRQIYLSVDAENAGALGMYYRRGFKVLREGIYYRKQL
jgi:ribosomal protein S18 acetylase RimI-like enzyme